MEYTLKVTDNSPEKIFGTAFDTIFSGEDVVDCITQILKFTSGENYRNHNLDLCFKSLKSEANLSWQKFITEGFELDGVWYSDDEDSRNDGNYWE